jgi:cyclic dehypoxanthinyl futalosine synthase
MMPRIRAAAVSFLNARPLTAALRGSARIELLLAEPSACAAMLERGEVEAALLPVAALAGHDYEVVPGVAIGSDGPVSTVILAGEQSPVVWDEVFLDTASRTSQVLAKMALAARDIHPEFTPMPAAGGLAQARGTKGALVIGDRAFEVQANHVLDLGREWTQMSGLPMVFAAWAARPGALRPDDVAEILRAAREGLGRRTELAQAFAREQGGDPERYRRYLAQRIHYGLGPHELRGLEAFLSLAAERGLLPPTELRFAEDRARAPGGRRPELPPATPCVPAPGGGGRAERRPEEAGAERAGSMRGQRLSAAPSREPTRGGGRPRRGASLDAALQKGADGERLDADEVELLDERAPLLELGLAADARRRALHPDGVVTYIVSRNVNYTNVCTTACHFCAFYRPRGHAEAYVLTRAELARKIEETLAVGGIELLLQGGLHPDLGLEWYEDLFRWVKATYPRISLHALSPDEIWHVARLGGLSLDAVLDRLVAAGLDSIPGGGAEVLDDEVRRRIAPLKTSSDEWLAVMKAAHRRGLRSTATLMFGVGEESRHRAAHLLRLRDLQDETGGFTAFICWTFQPENTRLAPSDNTAHAYLRVNALSRLVLDNVRNLQTSWVTMGGGVAQAALHMGCNDFGQVMIEENVVSAAGTTFRMDAEEMERHIREAGFTPARRNMRYERLPRGEAA